MRKTIIVLSLLGSISSYAWDLGVSGQLNMTTPRVDGAQTGTSYSGRSDLGVSFFGIYDITPMTSIESGLAYTPYGVTQKIDNTDYKITQTWNVLQIPLIARYNFSPWMSVGAGAYYGWSINNADQDYEYYRTLKQQGNTNLDLPSSARKDYGALASVRWTPDGPPKSKFLVEYRYLYGLKNMSALSGRTEKYSHMQIMAGLIFLM